MDAAQTIRHCIAEVSALRAARAGNPALATAVGQIKALQVQRFRGTYDDLMRSPAFAPAAGFFLKELYGNSDYTERDLQFGRIAGTLQTVFPAPVVATAVALAELHAQTEALDQAMGNAWLAMPEGASEAARYASAWRATGQRDARQRQLQRVLAMGKDLARLTRMPGMRTMLRMMRGPANAADLGALQRFLEAGFDTFGQLARQRGAVEQFLATVAERERALMDQLFDADPVACETMLARTLGQAR